MAGWRKIFLSLVVGLEDHFDRLKYRLRERLGGRDPLMIQPYRSFGSPERLFIQGRVLEDKGIRSPRDDDTAWQNLLNTYRRIDSAEIPFARVGLRFQDTALETLANEEGFFEAWLDLSQPLATGQLWHTVDLELLEPRRPGGPPVKAQSRVLVPPASARFGVISDIDDTVLQTDAANPLRMARMLFLGNARTRLPFKAVAAFYRALLQGSRGDEMNPLFYVSSSPWNLYDLLSDFFNLQQIPFGPVLFLRDWGLTENELLPLDHQLHKMQVARRLLDFYSRLPFLLIGDSGQSDPEIYSRLVALYPQRVLAIYIRNVSHSPHRLAEVQRLADEVQSAGSALILAENTLELAEHAAQQGWISPQALPAIAADLQADTARPARGAAGRQT
jgi:phosphatidate phosphatase APP1